MLDCLGPIQGLICIQFQRGLYLGLGVTLMMKKHLTLLLTGAGLAAASLSHAQGPSSPYYMGAGLNLWTALGTNAVSAPTVSGDEYNLAVMGDIRTTSQRNSTNGEQYDLSMVSTGTPYAGNWAGLYDGTTDGVSNFSLDYDTGNVLAFDRNWQGGTTLFNLGAGAGNYLGITYDGSGGLWVSQWTGTMVEHYSMSGTLLGSFNAGFSSITCLAMDYNTGTLWMGSQNAFGQFNEFTTSGTNLQTVFYGGMTADNTLGGEFEYNAVPEPASMAVLGLGLIALLKRKRSK